MPTKFQIVYWRDIPSQIICVADGRRKSRQLSPRFQDAIDRVAMSVGSSGTDEYLAEWRKSPWQDSDLELHELCAQKAEELESKFGPERLRALVANEGRGTGESK
jgi:hypothetical protein